MIVTKEEHRGMIARILWRLLSVPIYFKVLGIGAIVAFVFGSATLFETRQQMSKILYDALQERTVLVARSLEAILERSIAIGDFVTVNQQVKRQIKAMADIRYVIVYDAAGNIVAHTFQRAIPSDLRAIPTARSEEETIEVLSSPEGLVFQATLPILKGSAGTLVVGTTDARVRNELAATMRSVLTTLALCMGIGAGLALVLTNILTRPLHQLIHETRRIREGDFKARAVIGTADEIGRLAEAFNRMAEGLEHYHSQVEEKERVRQTLIQKIVRAQEEERKNISRELHDHLGQSLSALLLNIQAGSDNLSLPSAARKRIERTVSGLIEDVRKLAWGMRPSVLDDYGLDHALRRLIEDLGSRLPIVFDYQYIEEPGTGRLPDNVEITLFRVAQEAVTNVVRHSAASHASVIVIRRRAEVMLLVEDDGRGFDSQKLSTHADDCIWLSEMRERIALLSGECMIDSAPDKGVTIRIRLIATEVACAYCFFVTLATLPLLPIQHSVDLFNNIFS